MTHAALPLTPFVTHLTWRKVGRKEKKKRKGRRGREGKREKKKNKKEMNSSIMFLP